MEKVIAQPQNTHQHNGQFENMIVYCINLDRRPDRLQHIRDELKRCDVPFTRLAAVDGSDREIAEIAATIQPTTLGQRMSNGAFGALQSHRKAWTTFLGTADSHCVVIEDDMLLSDDFGSLLNPEWIPADADLVKLETWGNRVQVDSSVIPISAQRGIAQLFSSHIGAGAYVISRSAAVKALNFTDVAKDPVDEVLFNVSLPFNEGCKVYQLLPAAAVQGKRPQGKANDRAWAATSISERFADGAAVVSHDETALQRLLRRLREEIRSLFLGSRYIVVPFARGAGGEEK